MKQVVIISCCCVCLLLQTASGFTQNKTAAPATPAPSSAPLVPLPLNHGGKIETKYDGFNHETIVTLKKMSVTCGAAKGMQSTLKDTCVSFVASLHCPGKQLDYVRYAKLQLIFETKDWDRRHPLDARELFVVADGERLKLGRMALATQDATTERLVEVMKEVLEVSLSYQNFSKIARAQTVEMRVGNTVFELREKNVAALRDLNNRVKLPSGS